MKKLNKAGPRGVPLLTCLCLEKWLLIQYCWIGVSVIIFDIEPCPKLLENPNILVSSGYPLPLFTPVPVDIVTEL